MFYIENLNLSKYINLSWSISKNTFLIILICLTILICCKSKSNFRLVEKKDWTEKMFTDDFIKKKKTKSTYFYWLFTRKDKFPNKCLIFWPQNNHVLVNQFKESSGKKFSKTINNHEKIRKEQVSVFLCGYFETECFV